MFFINITLLIVVFVCYTNAACPDTVNSQLICEHAQVQLSCPSGQSIQILSATYGRTDTSTCYDACVSYYSDDVSLCFAVTNNNYNCAALNALSIYQSNCDGQNSCFVFADNTVFGDPCGGTWKYSQIQWKCQ